MKIDEKGINFIKAEEGLILKAYKCEANRLTIGYGHTKGVKLGDIITINEAENLLKEDLKIFEKYINNILEDNFIKLTQNQYNALVSFVFNVGEIKEKMVERLKKLPKADRVGESLLLYNKIKQKLTNGSFELVESRILTLRRQREKKLWETL